MEKKIISFDVQAAKARLSEKAAAATAFAKAKSDKAKAKILEKGIELSERQLNALKNAKKQLA